jgi:hypothetical protein
MNRFLVRVLLMACAFYFLLPVIGGISFHGTFLQALGVGLLFGLLAWVLEVVAIAVSAMLAISTFGVALLILIPLWVVGYWLFPALVLKLLADLLPAYLTVSGWGPAILGGLVLLVVGVITGGHPNRYTNRPRPA